MVTIKDRRETDKKRLQRHREKQKALGKKSVNVTLSAEAYERLQLQKNRTGETYSDIIGKAILAQVKAIVRTPVKKSKSSQPQKQ